jgi:phage terminase large subunit-like protein
VPPVLTKPGTRKLSDVARHVVVPAGVVSTGYPAVRDKCRDLGIVHDDWQRGLGRLILGKRADGKYAATVGGVVMSIPRQVGKTFMVGSIIFALCLLYPGLTVIWTAHRTRTSNETFRKMQGLAGRARVKAHVLEVRRANGEQEITFRNGSRIMFGAREQGFGRGFDEVDVIVFDEAQILTEKALEDMVAATNQSRHPAGALLFYMGTPPRPVDPGEVFTNKRAKALDNKAKGVGDMVYVEISADPGADPDDRRQWAIANPSYPKRTPEESMLRLRENVGSDESFGREALGLWDDDGTNTIVPLVKWNLLADLSDDPAPHVGPVVLAVDSDPARKRSTIVAVGNRAVGPPLLEITCDADEIPDNRAGVDWVESRIVKICGNTTVTAVVIDELSAAASLIKPLTDAGIPVVTTNSRKLAQAWGQFHDAVVETGDLVHLGDPLMTEAIRAAVTRPVGDAEAPDRKKPTADITPLTAGMLAYWGLTYAAPPANAGEGRVIALS